MDTLMLTAHINDTSKIYSWNFYVEILPDYPYSNIWLFVSMKSPDGTLNTDTLDFTLADNKGEWYGTHHDEYTLSRNQILPCMKYKSPGEYKLSIVQGMRTDNLKGIRNIELNLIACKKQ